MRKDQAGMRISKGTHSIVSGPGWYVQNLIPIRPTIHKDMRGRAFSLKAHGSHGYSRVLTLTPKTQSSSPSTMGPSKENATSRVRTPKLKWKHKTLFLLQVWVHKKNIYLFIYLLKDVTSSSNGKVQKVTNCFQSNAKDMTHSSPLHAKVCMEFAFGGGWS